MSLLDDIEQTAVELWRPREVEARTIGGVPWLPFVPFGQGGPVHPSKYHIGERHALRLAPLYGAVRLLADAVASLPIKIYRDLPDGSKQLWTGPSLFDDPGLWPDTTYDWIFACMQALLLHGNALGYITSRDGFGYPTQIVWLPPERCDIEEDYSQDVRNPTRARYYYEGRLLDKEDLVHIRALVLAGQVAALSPLMAFKVLIEGGLNRQEYSKLWFENGGFPPGVFQNEELEVDADEATAIRRRLTDTLRRRETLVIGRDWKYTPVVVPPDQAQFVETTRLDASQIAAIFQVPPEMIGGSRGDSMTYANQEQNTNSLITWSLRSWIRRLEDQFSRLMPTSRYVKFNVDDLVRVDQAQRFANYKIARDIGIITADEIRREEDMPSLSHEVGDQPIGNDILVAMTRGGAAVPKNWSSILDISGRDFGPGSAGGELAKEPASDALQPQGPSVRPAQGPAPRETKPDNPQPRMYSIKDCAERAFGLLGRTPPYIKLTVEAARHDLGYEVRSLSAADFTEQQAQSITDSALRRCEEHSPIERIETDSAVRITDGNPVR